MYRKADISIIISSNYRSYVYLHLLKKKNFLPRKIIFLTDNNEKKYNIKIQKFLKKEKNLQIKYFFTRNINSQHVIKYLLLQNEKFFVVSLYPGRDGIVKNQLILKKKFLIHSHPGKTKHYRGSTTIYYSLLKEKKIYCDTIILSKELDCGKVIYSSRYPIPKNIYHLDKIYETKIRAINLVESLKKIITKKNFIKKKKIKSNSIKNNYFIIHPILRLITFNKFKNVQN